MIRAIVTSVLALVAIAPARAETLTPITYLLPAPAEAIAFAPLLLAQSEGLYAKAGLEVHFRTIMGGAHVGEALGRGEGDLGGAGGDTAIPLRAKGIPVQGVALLGQHSFVTLMLRSDVVVGQDFKGKIDVPSLQDVSNYALKAWLLAGGADPAKVTVQALPSDATIARLGQYQIDGMVGTVDRGVRVERVGVHLRYLPLDGVYPAMAQAILASDTVIRGRPRMIGAFVGATLAAVREIERDPASAADRWRALMPASGYSREEVIRIFTLMRENIYGDPARLGRFDPRAMRRAVDAARVLGLVPATYRGRGSFTNRFVNHQTKPAGD